MSFGEFIGSGPSVSKLILHMNGNSNDSSGNVLNGIDKYITYSEANGRFNEGAVFNGINSKITLPASTILDLHMFSHTVIYWVKLTANPSVLWGYLAGKGSYSLNKTYWASRIRNNGKIEHLISSNSDSQYDFFSSTPTLPLGAWNCIIFTWDKTNRVIKCYLNGSLITGTMTNGGASLPVYQETINTYVGVDNLNNYGYLNGSMDSPIFESGIWTPEKCQKYYTNALGRF
jgi:hypothetical protein